VFTDRRESLHDVIRTELNALLVAISLGGHQMRVKKGAQMDHFGHLRHRTLPFDREYVENGKSQRYAHHLELKISARKIIGTNPSISPPSPLHILQTHSASKKLQ